VAGGTAPCVLNAANEVAVAAFLDGELPFAAIAAIVAATLESVPATAPVHFEELFVCDREARAHAGEATRDAGAAAANGGGR
jgi:1-deoxy-D-xylulose-5-phosphate reductoisomerase